MITPDQTVAVILAGGGGTRIRHLLPELPKPMAPVQGRPFLEWVVRYLAREGVRQVVISTGYKAEIVAAYFASQPVSGVFVRCLEETQPLGTAGGFLHATTCGDQPPQWLVLNGDSLLLTPLADLFQTMAEPGVAGVISGNQMPDASRYGTLQFDAEHWLTGFQEKQPGAGVINSGVYLFGAGLVETLPRHQPLSFERDVFPKLVAAGSRIKVSVTQAPFLDIGTPETLPLTSQFIASHQQSFVMS